MHLYERYAFEPKRIATPPEWGRPDKRDGYIGFSAPLELDGITLPDLYLKGGASVDHPHRHVTLELKVRHATRRREIALVRIDWKSLKGGHSNKRGLPATWEGASVPSRVENTHLHPFELNWTGSVRRMLKGNLPVAVPIREELQTFADLCGFAEIRFRINNMSLVSEPNWAYSLFDGIEA